MCSLQPKYIYKNYNISRRFLQYVLYFARLCEPCKDKETSKFKSMLDAFTDSMTLAEEATTANGNAEANQEKYMESTAGKLQAIKTQMQDFWVNFYNSGTVNGVLEFVHSLTEGFTSLEKTLGPIPALLTAVFAAMTVKNATMAGLKFLSGGGLATVVG